MVIAAISAFKVNSKNKLRVEKSVFVSELLELFSVVCLCLLLFSLSLRAHTFAIVLWSSSSVIPLLTARGYEKETPIFVVWLEIC